MTTKAKGDLSVAQIDVIRAQTLNELDAARSRLDESAFQAALPGGDEKAMLAARDAVHILELKVQGLAVAREKQVQVEEAEREAARSAERRDLAVKVRLLIEEHMSALMGLGQRLHEFKQSTAKAEAVADRLRRAIFALGDGSRASDNATESALVALGAFGTANIPFRAKALSESGLQSTEFVIGGADRAIGILSTLVPEFSDETAIEDARAAADARAIETFKANAADAIAKGEQAAAELAALTKE